MHTLLPLTLLAYLAHVSHADDTECKFTPNGKSFDLTELRGEKNVTRVHEDPPSKITDTLSFNICATLTKKEGVPDGDQCPDQTYACLIETNSKGSDPDRITRVIPVATVQEAKPESSWVSGNTPGLNLLFHGPIYPPPSSHPDIERPQSFNISILCPPDNSESKEPEFVKYENGRVEVKWVHKAGCENHVVPPEAKDPSDPSSGGSGVGYFFIVLLLAFVAYFVLGAYYNYNKYGAGGWDLIPHRDFWREVPFMLRDVIGHLCSSVRPRGGGRGGYVQV